MGTYVEGLRILGRLLTTHGEFTTAPRARQVVTPKPTVPSRIAKPGCTAADETILVMGHLRGVAEGKTSGVLALDPDHLERAALGAEQMGDKALAEKLRAFKEILPNVREAEAAQQAMAKLKPLADEAWELGRRCSAAPHVSPALYTKAQELAKKMSAGKITREQAVESLRREE